jgi:pSer/pThr/pTyr-binding forkhead associated (FHA) protein
MARLVVGKPPRVKSFPLDRPLIRIGRIEGVEIRLPGNGVSRVHARVFQIGKDFFIEDVGSKNGTWVDGIRVDHLRLRPGARVQIGPYKLRFEGDAVGDS